MRDARAILAALLLPAAPAGPAAEKPAAPNVIPINCDDLGYVRGCQPQILA